MLRATRMFIDSMRKQTNQCAQYKAKIVTKHDSRNTQKKKKKTCSCEEKNLRRVAINFAVILLVACKQHNLCCYLRG